MYMGILLATVDIAYWSWHKIIHFKDVSECQSPHCTYCKSYVFENCMLKDTREYNAKLFLLLQIIVTP